MIFLSGMYGTIWITEMDRNLSLFFQLNVNKSNCPTNVSYDALFRGLKLIKSRNSDN